MEQKLTKLEIVSKKPTINLKEFYKTKRNFNSDILKYEENTNERENFWKKIYTINPKTKKTNRTNEEDSNALNKIKEEIKTNLLEKLINLSTNFENFKIDDIDKKENIILVRTLFEKILFLCELKNQEINAGNQQQEEINFKKEEQEDKEEVKNQDEDTKEMVISSNKINAEEDLKKYKELMSRKEFNCVSGSITNLASLYQSMITDINIESSIYMAKEDAIKELFTKHINEDKDGSYYNYNNIEILLVSNGMEVHNISSLLKIIFDNDITTKFNIIKDISWESDLYIPKIEKKLSKKDLKLFIKKLEDMIDNHFKNINTLSNKITLSILQVLGGLPNLEIKEGMSEKEKKSATEDFFINQQDKIDHINTIFKLYGFKESAIDIMEVDDNNICQYKKSMPDVINIMVLKKLEEIGILQNITQEIDKDKKLINTGENIYIQNQEYIKLFSTEGNDNLLISLKSILNNGEKIKEIKEIEENFKDINIINSIEIHKYKNMLVNFNGELSKLENNNMSIAILDRNIMQLNSYKAKELYERTKELRDILYIQKTQSNLSLVDLLKVEMGKSKEEIIENNINPLKAYPANLSSLVNLLKVEMGKSKEEIIENNINPLKANILKSLNLIFGEAAIDNEEIYNFISDIDQDKIYSNILILYLKHLLIKDFNTNEEISKILIQLDLDINSLISLTKKEDIFLWFKDDKIKKNPKIITSLIKIPENSLKLFKSTMAIDLYIEKPQMFEYMANNASKFSAWNFVLFASEEGKELFNKNPKMFEFICTFAHNFNKENFDLFTSEKGKELFNKNPKMFQCMCRNKLTEEDFKLLVSEKGIDLFNKKPKMFQYITLSAVRSFTEKNFELLISEQSVKLFDKDFEMFKIMNYYLNKFSKEVFDLFTSEKTIKLFNENEKYLANASYLDIFEIMCFYGNKINKENFKLFISKKGIELFDKILTNEQDISLLDKDTNIFICMCNNADKLTEENFKLFTSKEGIDLYNKNSDMFICMCNNADKLTEENFKLFTSKEGIDLYNKNSDMFICMCNNADKLTEENFKLFTSKEGIDLYNKNSDIFICMCNNADKLTEENFKLFTSKEGIDLYNKNSDMFIWMCNNTDKLSEESFKLFTSQEGINLYNKNRKMFKCMSDNAFEFNKENFELFANKKGTELYNENRNMFETMCYFGSKFTAESFDLFPYGQGKELFKKSPEMFQCMINNASEFTAENFARFAGEQGKELFKKSPEMFQCICVFANNFNKKNFDLVTSPKAIKIFTENIGKLFNILFINKNKSDKYEEAIIEEFKKVQKQETNNKIASFTFAALCCALYCLNEKK